MRGLNWFTAPLIFILILCYRYGWLITATIGMFFVLTGSPITGSLFILVAFIHAGLLILKTN